MLGSDIVFLIKIASFNRLHKLCSSLAHPSKVMSTMGHWMQLSKARSDPSIKRTRSMSWLVVTTLFPWKEREGGYDVDECDDRNWLAACKCLQYYPPLQPPPLQC